MSGRMDTPMCGLMSRLFSGLFSRLLSGLWSGRGSAQRNGVLHRLRGRNRGLHYTLKHRLRARRHERGGSGGQSSGERVLPQHHVGRLHARVSSQRRCTTRARAFVGEEAKRSFHFNGNSHISLLCWYSAGSGAGWTIRACNRPDHRTIVPSPYPHLIQSAGPQHLAHEVKCEIDPLPCNYQVAGKHPANRFDSLNVETRTPAQAGRASASARPSSMGGPWRESRKARWFGLVPVCQSRYRARSPLPPKAGVRAIQEATGRSHHDQVRQKSTGLTSTRRRAPVREARPFRVRFMRPADGSTGYLDHTCVLDS